MSQMGSDGRRRNCDDNPFPFIIQVAELDFFLLGLQGKGTHRASKHQCPGEYFLFHHLSFLISHLTWGAVLCIPKVFKE